MEMEYIVIRTVILIDINYEYVVMEKNSKQSNYNISIICVIIFVE